MQLPIQTNSLLRYALVLLLLLSTVVLGTFCDSSDDTGTESTDTNTGGDGDGDGDGDSATNAVVRLVMVDPSSNTITIENFGPDTVNISSYRLCSEFSYEDLSDMTVDSGSFNLAAGDTVTISGWPLDSTADLGLYLGSGSFSSTSAMVDFVQWGSGGNGRESVAASKGIWSSGDFISGAGPYEYTGDGTQNGLTFW